MESGWNIWVWLLGVVNRCHCEAGLHSNRQYSKKAVHMYVVFSLGEYVFGANSSGI